MKTKLFLLFLALFINACNETSPVVGAGDVDQIDDAAFTITDYQVTSTTLTATGTVRNTGNADIAPVWYVEGEFYADGSNNFILGGDVTSMTIRLRPGVQTAWTLELSDPNLVEGSYPDFVVSNLRAYYK